MRLIKIFQQRSSKPIITQSVILEVPEEHVNEVLKRILMSGGGNTLEKYSFEVISPRLDTLVKEIKAISSTIKEVQRRDELGVK